jgi:tetratricopeptide (TPR) repeat protein
MRGPTNISRYRLVRRVGAGGMGIVYEAEDMRDGKKVALKVLLPHAAEEAEGVLRFKREFRALARLRHPNIVRVYDAGIDDDTPFIAMEFLVGKDVRTYLRDLPEGAVRDRETVKVLRQLLGALAHIHSRRIVHRDLKPENILVSADGRVKLMDFGVARLLRAPTSSSGLLGTFAYMAPEQVTTGEADGRSDLYAVGVVIFELLTGRYPFPVEPPAAALHHHVNTPPELVRHINPKADQTLAALAHRLLEKDPMDRFQSAEEAMAFLSSGLATGGESGALPEGSVEIKGALFVPRFVARDDELDLLEGVTSDATAGRGRMVLLEGPSGIGKTRLIEEVRLRIRRRTYVLIGQCAPEGTQPYGAFQGILDSIANFASRASDDVVQKIVGRDVALVAAVSPRLAALGGPVSTAHLDAAERKIRLHKAMVGVIGRLALTKSVVLVIEDLHWADTLTLELLWDAARTLLAPRPGGMPGETVCPVSIIVTRRSMAEGPDHSEALIRRLESRVKLTRRNLSPLGEENVAEMVRTMTGVAKPLPQVVQTLMEDTQGLPLMVQELIHSWVDQGILVRHRGTWSYRDLPLDANESTGNFEATPSVGMPAASTATEEGEMIDDTTGKRSAARRAAGHDDVVQRKMRTLDPPARELVERIALLGRVLPSDLLSAVSGLSEDQLLDVIDVLVRSNVLVEDVSPDGVRYRFYHEGFREAVTRGLTRQRRHELHQLLATRLERRFARRRGELAHVLARHFKQGEQPERAVRYLLLGAGSAAARGDLDGALRRLDDAHAILDESSETNAHATRRVRVLLRQIDLLLDFGKPKEALERADPQAARGTRSPEVAASELFLRRAACQFALGRIDEALASLGRIPKPAPTRSIGARGLELEGRSRMARGEYAKARAVLEAARDVARAADLIDLADRLEGTIGVVMLHQGDYLGALERLEAALLRARAQGQALEVADLVGHIGMIHAARNNTTAAISCYREALELSESRGVRGERQRWAGALGVLMTDLGQLEEAEGRLREALEMAVEAGNRQAEATWRGELGIHHFFAGRYDLAHQELMRCLAISRELGYARYEAWSQIYLGAVSIERDYDKLDEALEHIEQGLELSQEIGNEEVRIVGLLVLGRLRLAAGDQRRAIETLERADVLAMASQNLRLRARVQHELSAAG